MHDTILASALRILWRLIRAEGQDPELIFTAAGLDTTLVNQSFARYPVISARNAWQLAANSIKDPCFGIRAGQHWRPTDLHALGFAFMASRTLNIGLNRISRYNEVVDQVISFIIDEDDQHLVLHYHNARNDLPDIPALEDARWSIVLTMCRSVKPEGVSPARVDLTHPPMKCRDEYEAFFGCPIMYSQQQSALHFNRADVDEILTAVNLEVAEVNDRALKNYIERLHEDDLQRRVAHVVTEQLACGSSSNHTVARALCMSPRTLQRRLSGEGTSFKSIMETVREKLALEYLRDERLSLTEISYLLGFTQQSSFTRAFKRWTGLSPQQARQTIR